MSRIEKVLLLLFTSICLASGIMVVKEFHKENTIISGKEGGTFIEGTVGELEPLNPWFTTGNTVSHDITSLIFAGLMKYDAGSGAIIDDLATVQVSADQKTYTATLKPHLFWHDSTIEKPHPVTADDIIFTYEVLKDTQFQNPLLVQNFRGVNIEQINSTTVRFTLEKPYAFFTSNLTLGLLPKQSFEGIPPEKLHLATDFGMQPIGAGAYRFISIVQTDFSTEVTLKKVEREGFPSPLIDRLVLRIYPDYSTLLTDSMNLNAIRLIPRNSDGLPMLPKNFSPVSYSLPQYVAIFLNFDRPILSDALMRIGLQKGTNKQAIADLIHETTIVDSPLMELSSKDWRYSFDKAAAQGALFASSWHMPEKIRLQRLLEQRETNRVGPLQRMERIIFAGTGALLTLTGSAKTSSFPLFVNGIKVETGSSLPINLRTMTGSWMVKLMAGNGTSGSLKSGINIIKMTNDKGDIIDSAFTERFTNIDLYKRAKKEQELVDIFLLSKEKSKEDATRITVEQLFLEQGFLRKRTIDDPVLTRVNAYGKPLTLTLLTSQKPDQYPKIAREIQRQWRELGIDAILDIPETKKEFEEKLLKREYDIILFGESLLDNLDSYPYFHSSQTQTKGEKDLAKLKLDALNLSQYASFEADALLAKIRETSDETKRKKAVKELDELFKKDVPLIPLYSPLFMYAITDNVYNTSFSNLTLHSDRFSSLHSWYMSTKREWKEGKGWLSIFAWIVGK